MTTLAVTSVSSLLCHISTCFRIGSKFLRIRSTPTEMQSIRENDFECLASTGVKSPANAMFEQTNTRYPQVIAKRMLWGERTCSRKSRSPPIVGVPAAVPERYLHRARTSLEYFLTPPKVPFEAPEECSDL